ncbi:cobyrinate a,c-diamide synthase [Nocardia flavorosea]|uniref:Hydrogenobyrinate a,c-diamide synthase n=1 Tax=Nocardia flavorosea TaxID=53429 RepID=A0A846YQG8_9NOCA|nr:cobyrinate a,c-diamide synthase [Nocardia flavorosea]NKY59622.1 cobyrinate a,c-diamide synthase [Nocardia flavorosea]
MTTGAAGIVLAAPASGSGKTTVATGLIGALRRAGHRVAPFKVGPDYIDPGYHGLAAGRPGRNLDPVLVGRDRIAPLYRHGSRDCDLAVVEGVMGLFDGRIDDRSADPVAEGSTAQVASLLGLPVILVVDARGHSQSLAALLHGFATFDSGVRLGGVILNRVGSERHEQVLQAACDRVGLPVLGALPRLAELEVPSRHLGLIPAVEHGSAALRAVDAMTDLVARHIDLSAVAALAVSPGPGTIWDPVQAGTGANPAETGAPDESSRFIAAADAAGVAASPEPGSGAAAGVVGGRAAISGATGSARARGAGSDSVVTGAVTAAPDVSVTVPGSKLPAGERIPVIAMAGGPAFTFGYAEHRELLTAAGAEVAVFDPLYDPLPAGAAALVLPGGFPEEHAEALAANTVLRTAVAEQARHGLPIHAECAGLLYLAASLDGHPMAGVLDAVAEFGPRLTLGYREAVALADSPLWRAGERVLGHEFHRTRLVATSTPTSAWAWRAGREQVREGALVHQVHASYLHTHPAGNPGAVHRFVSAARAHRDARAAAATR